MCRYYVLSLSAIFIYPFNVLFQFSFQRYIKFVEDRLIDKEGQEATNSRYEKLQILRISPFGRIFYFPI